MMDGRVKPAMTNDVIQNNSFKRRRQIEMDREAIAR
jgi:hypothetical protein